MGRAEQTPSHGGKLITLVLSLFLLPQVIFISYRRYQLHLKVYFWRLAMMSAIGTRHYHMTPSVLQFCSYHGRTLQNSIRKTSMVTFFHIKLQSTGSNHIVAVFFRRFVHGPRLGFSLLLIKSFWVMVHCKWNWFCFISFVEYMAWFNHFIFSKILAVVF